MPCDSDGVQKMQCNGQVFYPNLWDVLYMDLPSGPHCKTNNFKSATLQYRGIQHTQINTHFYKPNNGPKRVGQHIVLRLATLTLLLVIMTKPRGFVNGPLDVLGLEETIIVCCKSGNKSCLVREYTLCINYKTCNFGGGQSTHNVLQILVYIRLCNLSLRVVLHHN